MAAKALTAVRTKRTAKKKAAFLAALEELGNVTKTCKLTKFPLRSAYDARDADGAFAAAWDKAMDRACGLLEDEAHRRAFNGTLKPVFHNGARCGAIREYSDTLLIFLLKGAKPEKYRDRMSTELTGKDGAPIQSVVTVYVPSNSR